MAVIDGTIGSEFLIGGAGDDLLRGDRGSDTVNANDGRDTVFGGGGSDSVSGGGGDDVLWGYDPTDQQAGSGYILMTRVAQGFAQPVFAPAPPVDQGQLYVLEQNTGRIKVVDLAGGQTLATPFLDIPDNQLSTGGERGLLGMAFHPDYAANGRFYVNLTNAAGDTEVWEYRRSDGNSAVADPASARLILSFDQPFANHNGGWMGFGPDGLLYIASGDGGGAGDPQGNAQNPNNLLGKILRIDVNRDDFANDPTRNYGIPESNPLAGGRPGADEIWVMGLRNPWRPSFDRVTGDFYIADVGQGAREEVNVIRAGQGSTPGNALNFGWDFREGTLPFEGTAPGGLIDPILEYPRTLGQSITGGYAYRPNAASGAAGLYFFADFVTGNLFTAQVTATGAVDFLQRNDRLVTDLTTFTPYTLGNVASFGQDSLGRLYVVEYDGDVWLITPQDALADGNDTLNGGEGNDLVSGGPGADLLFGGNGDDGLNGGTGADVLNGEAGNDTLLGGRDADILSGELGNDVMFGGDGNDQLLGGAGTDTLNGEAGNDLLFGSHDADVMSGESGNDTLNGEGGNDQLLGGVGDDVLSGELGDDLIFGGSGGDQLLGGQGADLLNGEAGADYLEGGDDSDTLSGEADDDLLWGGRGRDILIGGAGNDRFVWRAADESLASGRDIVIDYAAGDLLDLSAIDANSLVAGDQAFVFVEAIAAGAGVAILAYDASTNQTLFSGYVDGDGVPDIQILINGQVTAGGGWVL